MICFRVGQVTVHGCSAIRSSCRECRIRTGLFAYVVGNIALQFTERYRDMFEKDQLLHGMLFLGGVHVVA